jgi:bifunctional enzyme CysN/CysC
MTGARTRPWKTARSKGTSSVIDTLRFTTAGSVDDGKSTLIGRLLLESKALYQDQVQAVRRDSERRGHQGLDLSLFTDGLRDEREQKHHHRRRLPLFLNAPAASSSSPTALAIVQYTRNMVTGASTSELAVILVDARHGLVTQSKRHAFLSTLLGLPHLVVAVNKMDLVDFDEGVYRKLCESFQAFSSKLEVQSLSFLPISALYGDNVVERSARMPWYEGSTLLHHLETVNVGATRNVVDFRFPVQVVIRPHQDYRGYAGRVVSGRVRVGEEVVVLPSGVNTRLAGIDVYQNSRGSAEVGDSVVLRLADQIEVSRGDLIVRRNNLPIASDTFDAVVCWLGSTPLEVQKSYTLLHGTRRLSARVETLHYRIDVDTMHREPAQRLALNDIGRLRIFTAEPLFFDPYRQNRETGSFLLVDPVSHDTVAAGMIRGRSRGLSEVTDSTERASRLSHHRPAVVWLTGLSGSGKTTLANALEKRLLQRGVRTFRLDGDVLRTGLCADLGFSAEDRGENLRRAAQVAAIAWSQGMVAICSLISPFASDRALARSLITPGEFLEVHVHCPLEVCRARDPKGLYAKAERGEILDFTGISSPYEVPEAPELLIDTSAEPLLDSVDKLARLLERRD